MPPNTARCHIHVVAGRAKYEPEQRAIVWRIKRIIGGAEAVFAADVELTPSIREKAWSRPPIQVCSSFWDGEGGHGCIFFALVSDSVMYSRLELSKRNAQF